MKVIVIEEPIDKKVSRHDYMGYRLATGGNVIDSSGRDKKSSSSSSGDCKSFMIGCCIIHPL